MQIYTLETNLKPRMKLAFVRRVVMTAFIIGAAFSAFLPEVHAQVRSPWDIYGLSSDDPSASATGGVVVQAPKQPEQQYTSAGYPPLEGAVDPETYIVGPNDQFTVTIGGLERVVSAVLVSADGTLIIPGVGRVEAGGRTLAEVESDSRNLLVSSFRNVQVDVTLSRPREFWVHVTGAVPQPGRYLSLPVGRLEDVLKQAFLFDEDDEVDLDPTFRPALRNVSIKHQDGSTDSYDLVRYYRTGAVSANPYLGDGDIIFVRSYDRVRSSVFISGDVPFPGDYDHRPGDTILDLLAIGTGNVELKPDRVVRLTRRNPDGTLLTENFTLSSLMEGTVATMKLQPLDQITVQAPEDLLGIAAADGWFQYPGQYPIEVGVTTLVDLINLAGGFRDDALIRGSYLERNAAFGEGVEFVYPLEPETGNFEVRLSDFDFFSRNFLDRRMKRDQRVSVDVSAATRPDAPPVYLRDGDRLFVPRDENSVYVIGEVVRPGRTPIAPGYSAEDYIATAGGRGPRAENAYVIRAGSGQVLSPDAPVYSGDFLFVDRLDIEPSGIDAERLRLLTEDQKLRTKQIWLGAITATAAVITTTILAIDQLSK